MPSRLCDRLSRVLLCVVFSLLVSGCIEAAPATEPVAIKFMFLEIDQGYYEALLPQFEEQYPHITVELDARSYRQWRPDQRLEGADVVAAGDWVLSPLLEQGMLLELDALIEQDSTFGMDDFYPGTLDQFSRNGKWWGVPAGLDPLVTFYNQDLFDQYDVPYPRPGWTRAEFEQAVLLLRDDQTNVFGYAFSDLTLDATLFIYAHGGQLFDDLGDPTRAMFNDPLTVEALEWYFGLMHEQNAIPKPDELRQFGGDEGTYAYYGFARNQVGMFFAPFSQAGGRYWPQRWTMRWGMVPLPRDVKQIAFGSSEGYYVTSLTEHPNACWQWIKFLSRYAPERFIPPRKSIVESSEYGNEIGGSVETIRAALSGELLLNPTNATEDLEADYGLFAQAIQEIATGALTPAQAMEQAQQEAKLK